MEAMATVSPAANLPGASPATVRDVSQSPGPDTEQPQPAEDAPNGAHVNDVGADDKETIISHPATSMPELARPASETQVPLSLPLSAQIPAIQPPTTEPQSTQPPSAQPPSTQSPLTQPPLTQPPSAEPPSTQPTAQLSSMYSQAVPPRVTPPAMLPQGQQPLGQHQFYRWAPSNTVPPSGPAPPPSQTEQPRQQSREVNGVPKRFPSPEADHENEIPRFTRDLSLLADTVQQSSPEAVRRLVRDKWEKCILGSEFHHAFLINAIIHHASGVIMRRAIRDFGQRMVAEAKHEIANHLGPQDLDEIAPAIFEKCSERFLDRALEHRLGTIDARSLINALARAERLGYTNSDVLEDRRERVVPTAQMHSPETRFTNPVPSSQSQPPPAASIRASSSFQPAQNVAPATDLKCRLCWRQFKHTKPYEYHVAKQLCTKAASETQDHLYWCGECGAGFTTKAGHQYHAANAVCGIHVTAAATPRPQATLKSEVPPATNYAPHPIPPTQLPPISSQPYSTPHRSNIDLKGTPGSSQDDPYAHLTPQRRAELDEELRQAELNYAPRFKEAEEIRDPLVRKIKLDSLQNTFSTKQSMIRKRYGVRLRVRRTRAEIEEEKSRLGLKHGPSSPNPTTSTPSVKRQRSDDTSNGAGGPLYISRGPGLQTPIPPPSNHLSISQMNNSGLGGSTATAATTDPTASIALSQLPPTEERPPPNSLSSLQRKGYRVSSHVGQASRPTSISPAPRSGSASTPLVLDDSSDGTDSDGDIPATLPLRKGP
ncbi:hypothetical protein FHL15_001051 [Xylaria flabelliformis]|uniref:Uncharacterized protein n=1 Tax=Xylaria flabelliformis TaxID=2512241 RepID=A0A553ICB6_9PEZI|nr:hypothetical protein FHL15_001051 [Xylaria flabelliformis]